MGRHSAPDDDSPDDAQGTAVAVVDAPGSAGRHFYDPEGLDVIEAVLEDEAPPTAHPEAATAQIPAIVDPVIDAPVPHSTTDVIPVITEPILDQPTAPAEVPSVPSLGVPKSASVPKGLGHHASAADLTLVREHADVRARCIAALIVPFLIYVVVLFATGLLDTRKALFLLFAPLIVAGVLVGLFLDLGHKRYATASAGTPAPASEPSGPR